MQNYDFKKQPVLLIQGAMDTETEYLIGQLDEPEEITCGNWKFYTGFLGKHAEPVVISRTYQGMVNAAAATAIAMTQFCLWAVINLGIGGGHDARFHRGDIVVGERVVPMGAMIRKYAPEGAGIDECDFEPLPIEIFDKVRAKVQKNKYGKRSVQVTYLLRHKLKCGYCGHPISAESGTSSNGEVIHYYKCHGRKKYRNGCEKTALRKEFLENFVLENILRELSKPDTMNKVVDGLMQIQEMQNKESPILKTLLSEKRQTETALNNLMSAIEQGIISATTNKRLHELENKLTELERNILIEQSKTKITLSEDKIRKYYEQALLKEPQMLINLLIKQIVLYNDKMIVYYNSPIQTSPDGNSQGFSFYDEIAFMPYIIQNKPTPAMRAIRVILTV